MTTSSRLVVLHVVQAAGGGVVRHVTDAVAAMTDLEHLVAVPPPWEGAIASGAIYDHEAIRRMSDAGAKIHLIPMARNPLQPTNVRGVAELRGLVRRARPDVVHGHSSLGGALARLALVGSRIPVVYTPHAMASGGAPGAIERLLGRRTSRLIAVSETEAENIKARRVVAPDRVVVIPNGIDLALPPAAADLRQTLGIADDAPLVGTVIRLVEQKAPEQFVAIAREVARGRPDAHFLLIGAGPLQPAVDRAVADSDLGERWHHIQHLQGAGGALGQLDVFVLATRFEGGPYAPLEAMRAGTPVVLSDVAGNRDVVEHGISGFLAPFGDQVRAAQHVLELLDDKSAGGTVVEAAHRRLEERFDVKLMGETMSRLYRDVAEEAPSARRTTRRLPQPRSSSSDQDPDSSAARYNS